MDDGIFISGGKLYNKLTSTLISCTEKNGIFPAGRNILGKRIPPMAYAFKKELYKTRLGNYFMLHYSDDELCTDHEFEALTKEAAIEQYFSCQNKLVSSKASFGEIEEA